MEDSYTSAINVTILSFFNNHWPVLRRNETAVSGAVFLVLISSIREGKYVQLVRIHIGRFYKLALLDFELIFEVKMQECEGT